MKKLIETPKNSIIAMILLIVICEMLLGVKNMIIQLFGICLLPIILFLGISAMTNDKRRNVE